MSRHGRHIRGSDLFVPADAVRIRANTTNSCSSSDVVSALTSTAMRAGGAPRAGPSARCTPPRQSSHALIFFLQVNLPISYFKCQTNHFSVFDGVITRRKTARQSYKPPPRRVTRVPCLKWNAVRGTKPRPLTTSPCSSFEAADGSSLATGAVQMSIATAAPLNAAGCFGSLGLARSAAWASATHLSCSALAPTARPLRRQRALSADQHAVEATALLCARRSPHACIRAAGARGRAAAAARLGCAARQRSWWVELRHGGGAEKPCSSTTRGGELRHDVDAPLTQSIKSKGSQEGMFWRKANKIPLASVSANRRERANVPGRDARRGPHPRPVPDPAHSPPRD